MSAILAIEKADARRGIIQLVVAKARPAGTGEGDNNDEGLDPESFAAAMDDWTANFGREVDFYNPKTERLERRFNGIYVNHREVIKADLIGAWWFPDEQKYRIQVRPRNRQYAIDAACGLISGASWSGTVLQDEVAE